MKIFRFVAPLLLASCFVSAAAAQGLLQKAQQAGAGQSATPQEGLIRAGELQAGLVAERSGVVSGQPLMAGLRLMHDPHWHTYWRNPGDSGLPTRIEWELPSGWRAGPIQWPTPKRLPVGPLANFGYEDDLLLPVEIFPPAGLAVGSEVVLRARASWLVCKDVCIPGEAFLALRLPVMKVPADTTLSAEAQRFTLARERIPKRDSLRQVKSYITDQHLVLSWSGEPNETAGLFFPYTEGLILPSAAQTLSKTSGGWQVTIPLGESPKASIALVRKAQTVEGVWVTPGQTGLEWRAPIASGAVPAAGQLVSRGLTAAEENPAPKPASGWSGFWWAALAAVLGGMILNLMPCVFPVIGLKVLSFAQAAHSKSGAMQQALIFSVGVILSFVALAGVLISLRAAGTAVGWGFQLQNPWVVLVLGLLFILIAVNLFGGFEMGLLGVQAANLNFANRAASSSGALGSFSSGVLAVVVASPCTAPFMGSAIGFTASASLSQTFLVFVALGLGMSLPYLLLASWPGLLARLPRPGPWMVRFKQLMAFPMLAAAAWLFWVLATIQGSEVILAALLAATALAFTLWIYGVFIQPYRAGLLAWMGFAVGVAVLLTAMIQATRPIISASADLKTGVGSQAVARSPASDASSSSLAWQQWRAGLAERLQAEGKTVFVDFTASWCITCQANKVRVLNSESIVRAFRDSGVVTVRADWTRQDAAIASELAKHGRSGVPLYLVYSRSGGQPKILSEWLSEKEVLDAIR